MSIKTITLPKTNSSHLKMDVLEYFYVSLREGKLQDLPPRLGGMATSLAL